MSGGLPELPYAATALGCRLGGVALLVVLGAVAVFSRQIADALFGPSSRSSLITDRSPRRDEGRRSFAAVVRWMLFAWGGLGAVGGLLVLVGILACD